MPLKHYKCTNKECGHTEQEFFHTTELIPPELPCPKCDYNLEIPEEDNFCSSEHVWNSDMPTKAKIRKEAKS